MCLRGSTRGLRAVRFVYVRELRLDVRLQARAQRLRGRRHEVIVCALVPAYARVPEPLLTSGRRWARTYAARALAAKPRLAPAAKLTRGKVDVTLRFRPIDAAASDIKLNDVILDKLERAAKSLGGRFPSLQTDFAGLLEFPGVLVHQEVDQEGLRQAALQLLDRALADMLATE